MIRNRSFRKLVAVFTVFLTAGNVVVAEPIFLDFGAAWETRLTELTTNAGIAAFSAGERTTIQNEIESQLNTMYSAYSGISFSQVSPGGTFTTVDFGATAGPGFLGVAGLDFGNLTTNQTVDVFSANFDFIVEGFEPRATQIDELSTALAGTAGHELGHSFGLLHHQAYGTDGIDPSTYANTGGLQNQHVIATGSTGLSEVGRETERTFSEMSNLILEATGGFLPTIFGPQTGALAGTVLSQTDNFTTGDVGDTAGTAFATTLTSMPISGLDAFHNLSNLTTGADVDVYSFTTTGPSQLYAQIYSDLRWNDDFDSRLRLFDTDGSTVLADNTDVFYSGNTYNAGTFRTNDSALLGIEIASAGTYFLEVTSVGNGPTSGDDNGLYSLIFGVDVADTPMAAIPEPGTISLCLLAMAGFGVVANRRRRKSAQPDDAE